MAEGRSTSSIGISPASGIRIALVLAILLFGLGAILVFLASDKRTSDTSTLPQQTSNIDCGPRWSFSLVTDTNKTAGLEYLNAFAVVGQNDAWAVGHMEYENLSSRVLALHWDGA